MLSKMNDSIEDLTVPVTPLTNVELEKVTGGVMRDEYGRGCIEGDLPIFKLRNVNALHEGGTAISGRAPHRTQRAGLPH